MKFKWSQEKFRPIRSISQPTQEAKSESKSLFWHKSLSHDSILLEE